MSFGHDFNPFVPPFAAKREIRVRETELIHTLLLTNGASLTGDIGLAYVDGDHTFNKEQALCLPKILSRNCFAA
jgi:hypothetical protein